MECVWAWAFETLPRAPCLWRCRAWKTSDSCAEQHRTKTPWQAQTARYYEPDDVGAHSPRRVSCAPTRRFINVLGGLCMLLGTIAWSKLMRLGAPLTFCCWFRAERFHTLKIESEFFSRQGHCTLCRTSVYHGFLLKKNQRRSSFYFLTKMVQSTSNRLGGCLWKKREKKDFPFCKF